MLRTAEKKGWSAQTRDLVFLAVDPFEGQPGPEDVFGKWVRKRARKTLRVVKNASDREAAAVAVGSLVYYRVLASEFGESRYAALYERALEGQDLAAGDPTAPQPGEIFECGRCGQKLRAPVGTRVRCPQCGTTRDFSADDDVWNRSEPDDGEQHPMGGELGIPCPICHLRPVETAERLRFIRGMVIISKSGYLRVLGCSECVAVEARREALRTFLLGWWSIPWGLLTPFVVLQNLWKSRRRPNERELTFTLHDLGIEIADVEVGPDGMMNSERRLIKAVAQIVGQVLIDSPPDSPEWRAAKSAVLEFSGHRLTSIQVDSLLRRFSGDRATSDESRLESSIISESDRLMLLRAAVEVTLADGQISHGEEEALRKLASRLELSSLVLDRLLELLSGESMGSGHVSREVLEAYRVLGLAVGASTSEIRSAYRKLMLENHPDLAAIANRDSATTRAAEINRARDLLTGVSATV